MGTSVSQPSPNTPPWRIANAILGRPDFPIDRQNAEVWTAAFEDRGRALIQDLSSPLLARACALADSRLPPEAALQTFDAAVSSRHAHSLFLEIGRRALARATAADAGAKGFAAELFAEATHYYVSRDLPGFIGQEGRTASISDSIRLKDQFRDLTRRQVAALGQPEFSGAHWRRYVTAAVGALRHGLR